MSHIYDFQKLIFNLLKKNEYISTNYKDVYIKIHKDATLPHILLNEFKSEIINFKNHFHEKIEFTISVFLRQYSYKIVKETEAEIIKILSSKSIKDENFSIINISNFSLDINNSKDLMTEKFNLNFTAMIKSLTK